MVKFGGNHENNTVLIFATNILLVCADAPQMSTMKEFRRLVDKAVRDQVKTGKNMIGSAAGKYLAGESEGRVWQGYEQEHNMPIRDNRSWSGIFWNKFYCGRISRQIVDFWRNDSF